MKFANFTQNLRLNGVCIGPPFHFFAKLRKFPLIFRQKFVTFSKIFTKNDPFCANFYKTFSKFLAFFSSNPREKLKSSYFIPIFISILRIFIIFVNFYKILRKNTAFCAFHRHLYRPRNQNFLQKYRIKPKNTGIFANFFNILPLFFMLLRGDLMKPSFFRIFMTL